MAELEQPEPPRAVTSAVRGDRLPLRVGLPYFHAWPNDAGLLVASAHGLFERAGVDVEISIPEPLRGDGLARLVDGTPDFALCPANRPLVRAENGDDLIGVPAIDHRGLETIQTISPIGIEHPRHPEGRRIAMNATERGLAVIATVVAADEGNPEAVQVVDSGVRELSVDELPGMPRRSLRPIAPTWSREGRWGLQRSELIGPYADWLGEYGILASPGNRSAAVMNDLLPRPET